MKNPFASLFRARDKPKDAVSGAVGDAISDGVRKAVQPKVDEAANDLKEAANALNEAAKTSPSLEESVNNLNQAVEEAGAAGQTMMGTNGKPKKIDPLWNERQKAAAEEADYIAEGQMYVISNLNTAEQDAAVLQEWREKLPEIPVWEGGGYQNEIEFGSDYMMFTVMIIKSARAEAELEKYQRKCIAAGFMPTDGNTESWSSRQYLHQTVNGKPFTIDTEHAFDGDGVTIWVYYK